MVRLLRYYYKSVCVIFLMIDYKNHTHGATSDNTLLALELFVGYIFFPRKRLTVIE